MDRISPLAVQVNTTCYIRLILLLALLAGWTAACANPSQTADATMAAGAVLGRTLGDRAREFHLGTLPDGDGHDVYEYEASNGSVTVRGSSPVAIARGAYDYLRAQGLGMDGWDGPQFRLTVRWPDAPKTRVECPFLIRHSYNVVTAGYTTPFWTWDRWQQELDWQALHGYNMLMAPVATEAIAARVWKRLGLTPQEIDDFNVSPAYLPWQRMGNLCHLGAPLPPEWHADQIALQHRLLDRMRELGMEPVVQSFAGFVPREAFRRLHPETVLADTLWNAGFPPHDRPALLLPEDPLFATISKMYVEEWEKEFGRAKYFLADSFNEMQVPKTDRPVTDLLASYGQKTYGALNAADPAAVWVTQGWIFGNQRGFWTLERESALFSRVPDDRVLIIDYANEFYDDGHAYNGFDGKQWVYGFLPNFGGKTTYNGVLDTYASGPSRTLAWEGRKNLVGFTISGEGLENNAVIYELLSDAAWSRAPIDPTAFFARYSLNRYGGCPPAMARAWELLRQSCYHHMIYYPDIGWQTGILGRGKANRDPRFHEAVRAFLSCAGTLGQSPGYRADAVEMAALSLGLKADDWFDTAAEAYRNGDPSTGTDAGARGLDLLGQLDRLLESHPLDRLERWIDFARAHGSTPALKDDYESSARSIITVWGADLHDYSCRVWSGLVRDFYRERAARQLDGMRTHVFFDRAAWESAWVQGHGISPMEPFSDPLASARQLVEKAVSEPLPPIVVPPGRLGGWSSGMLSADQWQTAEWPVCAEQMDHLIGVAFDYVAGAHAIQIQSVALVVNGEEIAADRHDGLAGTPTRDNVYHLTIPPGTSADRGATVRATIRGKDGVDSRGWVSLLTHQ